MPVFARSLYGMGPTPVARYPTFDLIQSYRAMADDTARAAQERLDSEWPALRGTAETWEGAPAAVLLSLANGADLLVVGTRGRSHAASLVLGSVSYHVAQHARCPVVVIPHQLSASDRDRAIDERTVV